MRGTSNRPHPFEQRTMMTLPPHPSPKSDKQSLLSYESPCHGTTTSQRPRTVPFGLPGTVLVMHASGVRTQGGQEGGRYILPTGTAAWSGCSYAMDRVSSTQNIIQTIMWRADPPHFPAHVCMMFGRTPCSVHNIVTKLPSHSNCCSILE